MLKLMLVAGAGGFVGTCLRYIMGAYLRLLWPTLFPWPTFIVNIVGCLVIGIVYGVVERSELLTAMQVVLFTTGFCGGFTTFSSFANEAFVMGSKGDMLLSALYVGGSVTLGLLGVWFGRLIVRWLLP